jgi:hypothetical protein
VSRSFGSLQPCEPHTAIGVAPLTIGSADQECAEDPMLYVTPRFKPEVVNAAADLVLVDVQAIWSAEEAIRAYDVISNWRASHHRPLNTFYVTLKNRAEKISASAIVATRIKRLESIGKKLILQPKMRLSQMQDIAGCRAVMPDIEAVRALEREYRTSSFSHVMKSSKDYIANPKKSGYRGVHLIYRYKLRKPSPHEGLRVEIQIRTQLQHYWATAVEAAGTFTNQALKSSQGSADWQRFFALMGSYISFMEGSTPVPDTPTDLVRLKHDTRLLASKLHVINILRTYSATLRHFGKIAKMKYYLMELDPDEQTVRLHPFTANQTKQANDEYTEYEKNIPAGSNRQVVLVSVDSVQALRQAYPNYFLDTTRFVDLVRDAIDERDEDVVDFEVDVF